MASRRVADSSSATKGTQKARVVMSATVPLSNDATSAASFSKLLPSSAFMKSSMYISPTVSTIPMYFSCQRTSATPSWSTSTTGAHEKLCCDSCLMASRMGVSERSVSTPLP